MKPDYPFASTMTESLALLQKFAPPIVYKPLVIQLLKQNRRANILTHSLTVSTPMSILCVVDNFQATQSTQFSHFFFYFCSLYILIHFHGHFFSLSRSFLCLPVSGFQPSIWPVFTIVIKPSPPDLQNHENHKLIQFIPTCRQQGLPMEVPYLLTYLQIQAKRRSCVLSHANMEYALSYLKCLICTPQTVSCSLRLFANNHVFI